MVKKLIDKQNVIKSIFDTLNEKMIGNISEPNSMKNLIAMVSKTDSPALILGETGTGKA